MIMTERKSNISQDNKSNLVCLSSYRNNDIKNIKRKLIEANNLSLLDLNKQSFSPFEEKLIKNQESKRNSIMLKEKCNVQLKQSENT
jgi:hypothetical protein